MARTPFLGPAYQARSANLADQQLINLYLESAQVRPGEASAPSAFFGCPGLVAALTLPTMPVRALRVVSNILYAVGGNTAYSISTALAVTTLGTLGTSTGQAYITANATQVGFFDNTGLWSWDGASFASVTLPYSAPIGMPTEQDTFVLLTQPNTDVIWQSDSNDLTTWDALNFTTEDGNPEPVIGLAALHDQVVVFKQFSTCFYVNEGNSGFAYGRLSGVYPAIGCVSASTISVINDRVCWLGQTRTQTARAYILEGYEAREISTYAIDNTITTYSTYQDATAVSYGQEGHSYYMLTFPTGDQTWVYDLNESSAIRVPAWHQRAAWDGTNFHRYALSCAANFNGLVYGGDYQTGKIYVLSLTNYQDNGVARKWLRTWRHLPEAQYATSKVNYLAIKCQTGLAQVTTDPTVSLRQSFDDGNTWSNPYTAQLGIVGDTMTDVKFNRLGAVTRGLNSDRIFELSSTDNFMPAFMVAEAD